MKRKLLTSIISFAMVASLVAGCGDSEEENQSQADSTVTESEQTSDADVAPSDTEEESTEEEAPEDVAVEIPELTTDLPLQDLDVVYMVGDTCYELYNFVEGTAADYAEEVNYLASELEGTANVYDIIVPTSMGISFPDNLQDETSCSDMQASVDKIVGMMENPVKVVNPYSLLLQHRLDYLFYRTDHHWTGLGAYYAYVEYCKVAGLEAHSLDEYTLRSYSGFLGSFYNDANKPENLANNPDTVDVYVPVTYESASMTVTDKDGQTFSWPILCDVENTSAGNKYGTFIAGDNPYTVIENSAITDGSSCVVVKESFGNAFVPYLLDHYQTVYVIDYRYWSGNLISFVTENGVDDVILCNNVSMIRNKSLVGKLAGVLF